MAGQFDIWRRIAAEAIGTAFLVTAVVGSGIMAASMTGDSALALLANTIATACALFVLITILGPISGAHLNPAVSLVMALHKELSPRDCAAYAAAQFTGGVVGTFLAHTMFDRPIFELSLKARSGEAQWFSEGVATFGLVFVILAGIRLARGSVAMLVALYIAAAYWFTASTSFANPAVTVARALTDTFAGIRPIDVPPFVVAQLAGALAASALCSWLLESKERQV